MYAMFKVTEKYPAYCPYSNPWGSQIKTLLNTLDVEHLTDKLKIQNWISAKKQIQPLPVSTALCNIQLCQQ